MSDLQQDMQEYRKQVAAGVVPRTYRGLMDFMMSLRTYLEKAHPDYVVPGNIYYGFMDMTYIAFHPRSFKERGLKVPIVYLHATGQFQVWLSGANRGVHEEYWQRFQAQGHGSYRLVPPERFADSILEHTLVEDPDFSDLDALMRQIEQGALTFIREIDRLLLP